MRSMIILFVADQAKSKDFYQSVLALSPTLDVPGMTEFALSNDTSLGLMPGNSILRILDGAIPNPNDANGIPRSELYLFVSNPAESLEILGKNGGKVVSPVRVRSWGDKVGYGLDLDGHLIAFAVSS